MKNKIIKSALLIGAFWILSSTAFAAEITIYSNETATENAETLILDNDNTGGDVTLQFGQSLNEQLYWNNGGSTFQFTDDLHVGGVATVDGSTLTLDNDNTGGNVDLIFGQSAAQYLRHDGTLFHFSDDVRMATTAAVQFRDAALAINSSTDGQLDIDADTEVEITTTTVDLNGNLDVSGTINGTTLSTTALDFQGNATIGTADDTLAIETSDWDVSTAGAITGVAFDANGTGNSLSNVDVADLANGTDGQLITWGADAAPTTVATGNAGEVLTSNGAGAAPTFQAGGSGDITDVGDSSTGAAFTADGTGNTLYFEGSSADVNEVILTSENATADQTITLPNKTGTVVLGSYGELYEDGGSTAITVTTAGTYYQWASTTVGDTSGAGYVVGSAASDNLTIGASGGGVYLVNYFVSFIGINNRTAYAAVAKNGTVLPETRFKRTLTSSTDVGVAGGTGIVSLASGDTIDLRFTSSTNGDTVTPVNVGLVITRIQ